MAHVAAERVLVILKCIDMLIECPVLMISGYLFLIISGHDLEPDPDDKIINTNAPRQPQKIQPLTIWQPELVTTNIPAPILLLRHVTER